MADAKVDSTLSRPLAGLVGRILAGRYRLAHLLGQGGHGAVYEAESLSDGAPRAIKALHPASGVPGDAAARLRREAEVTRRLSHPNILQIEEVAAEGDEVFLVMELLRGHTLAEALHIGPLPARRTLVLARQVLEALGHAHERGVVHRDVKPEHVFLTTAGEPGREYERAKLIDFSVARLMRGAAPIPDAGAGPDPGDPSSSDPGLIIGTPAYMAPEQALGQLADGRADLYALGATIFTMLTGRPPFRSPDVTTLVRMQISAPPPTLAQTAMGRPWCTPALEALVARALAKRPEDRFADAAEMTAALERAFASLDHLPPGA